MEKMSPQPQRSPSTVPLARDQAMSRALLNLGGGLDDR
jgi:hypothetical protein